MAAKRSCRFFGLTFFPPYLLLIFCLSGNLHLVTSSNPVMTKSKIDSKNNVHWANASSYIKWGDVPKTKSIDIHYEKSSDGLDPLFKFSRFFVKTTLNNKLPIEMVKKIQSGNVDILQDGKKFIMDHIGFLVTIAVGLIFVVIFPLVGCFFCFCRCCNKCGGEMIQTRESRSSTSRRFLSFLLLLGVVLSASGTAFMFASDFRLTTNINQVPGTLSNVMAVMSDYGDNTYTEIDFLGSETVDFLLDVIKRDLNNLDVLVGKPIREELDKKVHIRKIFATIKDLAKGMQSLEISMNSTMKAIDDVKTNTIDLDKKLNTLRTKIVNVYTACNNTDPVCKQNKLDTKALETTFSAKNLPDLSKEIKLLTGIDLLGKIKQPETDFEDIPELVHNKSAAKIQDVNKILDDVQSKIPEYLDQTKKFKTHLKKGIVAGQNLKVFTNQSNELLKRVMPYNQLRSYAFLGLAGLCLFIVALLLFGLILGTCGNDDYVNPVNRGSTSNCGGCLLMGSVYFIFLIGWLLMLLTTIMFIPGAFTEVYGCRNLREIGQGSIDKVLVEVTGHNFGKILFNNDSYNVTISHIYNGCKNGQGIYKAAYLKYFVDLNSIFNYPQDHGVKNDLTSIKVNLSDIQILTPEIEKQLNDSISALKIDFDAYNSEISKTNSPTAIIDLSKTLDLLSSASNPYGSNFKEYANDTRMIEQKELRQLKASQAILMTRVNGLKQNSISANNSLYNIKEELIFAQDVVMKNGSEIVREVLIRFADRILKIWDSFVIYVKDLVDNKIAKCRPITDLYNYLVIDMSCGVIDSYNAFWFGLGWCLFFLVLNLCFAVKLAKYFRRMKYSDELDGSADLVLTNGNTNGAYKNGLGLLSKNKIGQSPRY